MLRYAEMALAAVAFIILTGTNLHYPFIGVPADLLTEEEVLQFEAPVRNAYLLVYIIVVGLSVLNWKKMILGMAAVWPIMALIALAWLSMVWSVDPETTQRRSIALTITTLMGVYLFARFDFNDMLRFLTVCMGILIVISFLYLAIFPTYATHQEGPHVGVFRGVFFHKNNFGRQMTFALAILFAAWYAQIFNRAVLALLIALALAGVAASTSKTALISLFILFPGLLAVHMVRGAAIKSAVISLALLAIAWHAALLLYFTYEDILVFLGRDPTLTGRTELWAFILDLGLAAPFTGYGYDAFWAGDYSPGAPYALAWGIKQAHNAWLEVLVALGFPGVLMLFGIMLVMTFRAIILARYYPERAPAVLVMLISFLFFTVGLSETMFLQRHTSYWMLLIAAAGCARALTWKLSQQTDGEAAADVQTTTGQDVLHARPRPV